MKDTEPKDPPTPAPSDAEVLAWLDGLAGRTQVGVDAVEGAQLRQALLDDAAPVLAGPWSDIMRLAGQPFAPTTGAVAANDGQFRLRAGGAVFALFFMASVIGTVIWHDNVDELQILRGVGTADAVWRIENPVTAGEALAEELRALGATVHVVAVHGGVLVRIDAPQLSWPEVNQRLQPLETALDTRGQLTLRILAQAAPP